jgi:hypothetical protein
MLDAMWLMGVNIFETRPSVGVLGADWVTTRRGGEVALRSDETDGIERSICTYQQMIKMEKRMKTSLHAEIETTH